MPAPAVTKLLNASWFVLERGVGILIGLFVMVLVARYLGPELLGAYAYLFSLAALLMPLAQFGLENLVMRRCVAEPQAAPATIGGAIVIASVGAVIGAGAMVTFVALFGGPAGVTPLLALFAAMILLAQPADTFNMWLKARELMARVVLPRIAVALALAVVALVLVWREAPLDAFVMLRGAEAIGFALVAVLAYAMTAQAPGRPTVERAAIARLARDGLPLALSAATVALYTRLDQVMLGQLGGEAELGHYSIAVRLAEIGVIVPIALRTSLFAGMVRAFERAADGFAVHAQRLYDALMLGTLATGAVLAIGFWLTLVPVFGEDFAPALPLTWILLLSLPWIALGLANSTVLVVEGKTRTVLIVTTIGAVSNIVLNFALIPLYGATGAAIATVVSYWLATHGAILLLPGLHPIARAATMALNPVGAGLRLLAVHRGERTNV